VEDPAKRLGLGDDQFVVVQPGRFAMGSASGAGDELPVHEVVLTRPFRLQVTEVTQGQWRAVMGTNPSRFGACGDTCPAESVSWDDAQAFIGRLNSLTGHQFRLPTEGEWEFAARAGTVGDDAEQIDRIGWYAGNAGGGTRPVRQQAPNAWGLYDMNGNVWEWVQDYYAPYDAASLTDPTGPASGEYRALRGGSWFDGAESARSAAREGLSPAFRNDAVGVRLVRER
jgi:formylglycine-generating enzyme required for sulfatase activity